MQTKLSTGCAITRTMLQRKIIEKVNGLSALAILLAGLLFPATASASASAWAGAPEATVRLIAGQSALGAGGPVSLAVQFSLAPGWKTYWRYPGESGAPPRFDWSDSANLAEVDVRWPAPTRFSAFGFDSFGYAGNVVLPVEVTPKDPASAMAVRLDLQFLVCEKICLPVEARLALDLPAGAAASTVHAGDIEAARQMVPKTGSAASFRIAGITVEGDAGNETLIVEAAADRPFVAPDLMVEGPMPFGFGRPETALEDGGRRAILRLPVYPGAGKAPLAPAALRLTLVDGNLAAEHTVRLE